MVRRSLTATMSRYLIDRIEAAHNVEIWEGCEVTALHRGGELEAVTVTGGEQGERRLRTAAVFATIGASPRTEDVVGLAGLDRKGFIVTGENARRHPSFADHREGVRRRPLLLGTTRPGIFAIGDVRSGSTKRVASAVGDGALVVRSLTRRWPAPDWRDEDREALEVIAPSEPVLRSSIHGLAAKSLLSATLVRLTVWHRRQAEGPRVRLGSSDGC
jgi:thioredoxin reductase